MAAKSRTHQYILRLNEDETWELYSLVQCSGLSQQEYMRRCVLGQKITNTDGIAKVIPELKRIGNNLNQVARSCNRDNQATADEIAEIKKGLIEIWQLLKQQLADTAH